MSDARHHGHGAGGNGARQPTVVEGHEILEGSAAAHEEHHLSAGEDHLGQTVHEPVGRPGALHGNAGEQDAKGYRRRRVRSTSWTAAPRGEVTSPMVSG